MQGTQKPPTPLRRFYISPRILCILGFVFAYLIGLTVFAPSASAAALSAPGGDVSDPVVRQVDIARPAVVRILTTIHGQLTVRFSATVTQTFPLSGDSYSLTVSGSGAFISAHGDILTADHVVDPPHADLDNDLYMHAAQDVADYINTHFQVSAPYGPGDIYNALAAGSLPSTSSYGQPSSQVYLSTSYVGSINATKISTVPASDHATVDKIEAQSSVSASDVAVIHVSGMDNMPSILLADSSKVAEQDNLTIIGYPGLADLSSAPTNLLTSSINKVYVSALKQTDSGSPVIQVGGNIEHGDSGGPALDQNGNIVGIVSFGLAGADSNDYGQTTFLQASNSAETLIHSLGLNTAPGPFEAAWTQAIDDYSSSDSGHWQKANQELHNLATAYPAFHGISPFLAYAQNQAAVETNNGSGLGASTVLWIVLAIVVLLVLLGVGFYLLFRRNTRAVVVAPGGVQYPAERYGAYTQQSGVYNYNASSPYAPTNNGAQPQPVATPSGVTHANYTSPAVYGAPISQVPQTPLPVGVQQQPYNSLSSQVPQTPRMSSPATPLPQTASAAEQAQSGFSVPPMQTPRPFNGSGAQHSLPTWAPQAQQPESVSNASAVRESNAHISPEASTLSEVMSKRATYAVPADQAESLSPRMLDAASRESKPPSNDGWSSFVARNASSAEMNDKTVASSSGVRAFPFPSRPTSAEVVAPEAPEENASPSYMVAPCGHPNPLGVRYCLVCGRPIASAENGEEGSQG